MIFCLIPFVALTKADCGIQKVKKPPALISGGQESYKGILN